jgi:hypothetical protein
LLLINDSGGNHSVRESLENGRLGDGLRLSRCRTVLDSRVCDVVKRSISGEELA